MKGYSYKGGSYKGGKSKDSSKSVKKETYYRRFLASQGLDSNSVRIFRIVELTS